MKRRNLSCLFCMFAALGLSACDDDSVSPDNNQSISCGNGQLEDGESCDDGNTNSDDGCDADCVVEAGWECSNPGESCTKKKENDQSVCGDGKRADDEACDDGNKESGDGCDAACVVEDGWICSEVGKPCEKKSDEDTDVCGDGVITGLEACDDGNAAGDDGCSSACVIEDGWKCEQVGQQCTKNDDQQDAVCGDGTISGEEQCDDGNTASDDGCSSACAIEDGWKCEQAGQPCTEADVNPSDGCGDGTLAESEACDDGNTEDSDGCSAHCSVEEGWTCSEEGSDCITNCGDAIKAGEEACDDGNAKDGDGCSALCVVEDGWVCPGDGIHCKPNCGDGQLVSNEQCDDGNENDGDGCSKDCIIEEAWQCAEVGKPCTPEYDDKKSIKILGLGNSFMRDATFYLYDILLEMGYTDITIGVLYTGGRSINWHAAGIKKDGTAEYYHLDKNGKKTSTANYKYMDAIKSDKWDYFVMQTYPSGVIDLYNNDIDYVINVVNNNSPKKPIFAWSMTWGFQLGSPHSQMIYHGHTPLKMYEATVMAVQTKIAGRKDIPIVIPVGTAVENLRNGIIADNMNRDGFHMSYPNGRFAAALMWAKQITKRPIGKLTFTPDLKKYYNITGYTYTDRQVEAIKEAVLNAYKNPYNVTLPEKGVRGTYLKGNKVLEKVFADAGHDLKEFVEVPVGVVSHALYNATVEDEDVCKLSAVNKNESDPECYSSMVSSETGSKNTNLNKFAASRIFTHSEIPNGSFIVLKSGYEYRPEGWTDLRKATEASKRPAIVNEPITEVTDDWWGKFEYRAFTLSKNGAPELNDDEMDELESAMSIFIPIHHDNADDAVVKAGYDLSKYNKLDLSMAYQAFWDSEIESNLPTGMNMPGSKSTFPSRLVSRNETATKWSATRIFKKAEIPNGSLIVAVKGYQYIPDAWVKLDESNAKAKRRPKMVQAKNADSIVVVDAKWWGDFKYRGFDIARVGSPVLTPSQHYELGERFGIYVPKKQ